MKWLKRLRERWKGWRQQRRVAKGKQLLGRQEAGQMPVESKQKGTMSARVYRKETDTWEDLGVIGEFGKEN
jgi:hypothetical protein